MEKGWSMRTLATFLLITMLAVAGAPEAAGRLQVLDALDDCKAGRACVAVVVRVASFEGRRANLAFKRTKGCGLQLLKMKGRLGRGLVRDYALAFEIDCVECAAGFVAYLGRSADNHPLVQTRQGAFEVIDSGVDVGEADDLLVVDEESGAVVGRYIGNYPGSGDFYFAGEQVFMKHEGGPCIAAPTNTPGLLRLAPGHCKTKEDWEEGFVTFAQARPQVQATVRKYLPKAYPTDFVGLRRIAGTKLLALQVSDNCYQ
jgi:hypothetical protein